MSTGNEYLAKPVNLHTTRSEGGRWSVGWVKRGASFRCKMARFGGRWSIGWLNVLVIYNCNMVRVDGRWSRGWLNS